MAKREMKFNKNETPAVVEGAVEVTKTAEESVTVENPAVIGIVRNCSRLNVRSEANKEAKVLCTINEGDEVDLIEEGSTNEFYKVIVSKSKKNKIEGYCMRRYITIK